MNRLLSLLMPMTAKGVGKVRVGCDRDGGYVMLDDFRNINSCYSVGIGPEVSWDLDMAGRGLLVFQYDHTVKEPPVKHDKFVFTPVGLGTVDDGERRTLATLVRYDLAPSILKIDIEGAEWEVFDSTPSDVLGRFQQIVCEFHHFNHIIVVPPWRERAERVLELLALTHWPVHVHGNNWNGVTKIGLPNTLEVTFASRAAYQFEPSTERFPTPLDRPNNPAKPDLALDCFNAHDEPL